MGLQPKCSRCEDAASRTESETLGNAAPFILPAPGVFPKLQGEVGGLN